MRDRQGLEYARIRDLIKTLFENFKIFRGEDLRNLLNKLGIQIEYARFNSASKAFLMERRGKFIIRLPKENTSQKLEKFLIYHELAHWILIKYKNYGPLGKKEYWECECWCDSFALAMICHEIGFEAVNEANFEDFFQDGAGLEGDTINLHVARRIEQLTERAKLAGNESASSLTSLAKIICSHDPSSQSD